MALKRLNVTSIIPTISSMVINKEKIINVENRFLTFTATVLKNHINYQYKILTSVSGVDLMAAENRFAIVYDLLSLRFSSRLRLRTFANESTVVPSLVPVYINANWWEREVWDMFGVYFINHPELRRILTDYGFEGYPLRKDFPLVGFCETQYFDSEKRVEVVELNLTQEMRPTAYEGSWQYTNF